MNQSINTLELDRIDIYEINSYYGNTWESGGDYGGGAYTWPTLVVTGIHVLITHFDVDVQGKVLLVLNLNIQQILPFRVVELIV